MEKRLPQTKHWTRPSLRPTAALLGRLVVVRLVVVLLVVVRLVVVLLVVVLCVVVLLVVVLLVVVLIVVVVVARVVVGRVVVTTLVCLMLNFIKSTRSSILSIISTHKHCKYLAWTRLNVVSLSDIVLGCLAVVGGLLVVVVVLLVVVVGLLVVVVVVLFVVVVLLVVVVVLEVGLLPFNLLSAVRQDNLQGNFSGLPSLPCPNSSGRGGFR